MRRAPLLAHLFALGLFGACDRQDPPHHDGTAGATPTTPTIAPADALAQARELLAVSGKADPPKALALLEQAFGPAPSEPEAAFLLARAAFRADQPEKCRVALAACFAHPAPDHPEWTAEAWVLHGWLFEREGRPADALPDYREALAVVPDYAWAMHRMGSALADAGDVDGAIGWIEKAIGQRPALLEAHFALSHLYRSAGRTADAERETAIHKFLNQTTDNTANTRESVTARLAAYTELEELLPQWIDGRITLTQMQLKLGRRDVALERLRKLVAEHPESDAAKQLLAAVERPQR